MAFGEIRKRIEPRTQVFMLAHLDKPQMPFRQRGYVARQRTQDGNAKLSYCIAHQAAMAFASDAVQDHASNADVGIVA